MKGAEGLIRTTGSSTKTTCFYHPQSTSLNSVIILSLTSECILQLPMPSPGDSAYQTHCRHAAVDK